MLAFDFINGVSIPPPTTLAPQPAMQDAGSRATPVSSIVVTLTPPVPAPTPAPTPTLDDFELFYSPGTGVAGEVIDLTPAVLPPTPPPTMTSVGAARQIDFLSEYTKLAGTYILRLANPAVSSSFAVTWVMTTTTPGELSATLTPTPPDPTPATPRNTPVDSMTVEFTEAVKNVDLGHFQLTRNGTPVPGFVGGLTLSGSGNTYVINGLSPFTGSPGSYQLVVNPSFTPTVGSPVSIETFAGGKLLAPKSSAWSFAPTVRVAAIATGPNAGLPNVVLPPNRTYLAGEVLSFDVTFTDVVQITGVPSLPVVIGATTVNASYVGGSGSTTLKFNYQVTLGDQDPDGISLTGSIGGSVVNSFGDPVVTTFAQLPAALLAGILVDGVAPAVTGVTPPAAQPYVTGGPNNTGTLTFSVLFDEAVRVTGAPTLAFTIGGVTRQAALTAASSTAAQAPAGTTTLNFSYTIAADDSTINGINVTNITLAGGTIKDVAGNNAVINPFTPVPSAPFGVNRTGINGLAIPGGTVKAGDAVEFTATYSQVVTVTGTPRIPFLLDSSATANPKFATYVSGNGTTTLRFRYTVQAGDLDATGIELSGAVLDLNGGTINDANNIAAATAFTIPANIATVLVDGVSPTIVLTPPPAGDYITDQVLSFTVTPSEAVVVVGTPTLSLTVGIDARQASYDQAASTPTLLIFTYKVASGDSANGVTIGSIALNGGSIKDAAANNATLTISASGSGIVINRTYLESLKLSSVDNKSYRVGESIELVASFNLPVSVGGIPTLPLMIGTVARNASYISGTGTKDLRFLYTIVAGDIDADGIELVTSSIVLTNATITNRTIPATVLFAPLDISGVKVDGTTPKLLSVTGPGAQTYLGNASLQFTATFDKSMTVKPGVEGTLPRIALVIGTVTKYAEYIAGDQTPVLVFEYKVAPGDFDHDGVVAGTVIQLNGALITDLSGNSGGLTFAPLALSGVKVDGTFPTVSRFSVLPSFANGDYTTGTVIPISATMSEVVLAGSEIEVTLDTGAAPIRLRAAVNGTTLSGTYRVGLGENSPDLTVTSFADLGVSDTVGNPLGNAILPAGLNNIGGSRAIVIDTTPPLAPIITTVEGNFPSGTRNVPSGGVTNDNTPTVSGTAEPATTIILKNGFTTLGATTVDANRNWSITTTTLEEGAVTLVASAVDTAGNSSSASSPITIGIDTVAPASPTFGAIVGSLVSGKAEAAAEVTILRNGTAIGTAIAAANGDWSCSLRLVDGVYTLTATASDAAGNISPPAQPTTVTIDTEAPLAPVIVNVVDNVDLLRGSIASGGLTNDSTPTVSGTAEPRSVVSLWSGVTKLGTATVNDGGAWSITPSPLASGTYLLVATATDANGNTSSASAAHAITIDSSAPQAPTITAAVDDVLQYTGPVASGGATNDVLPTFNGIAEKGSLVSLMNGASVIGTTTADSNGQWSITPATALSANGLWALSATATDPAGNVSDLSVPFRLTIDTVSPSAPVITAIESDGPPNFGTLASGSQTNDRQLIVTGKTEPNGRVTFWINHGTSRAVNIVTRANPSGDWTVTTPALTDGPHAFSAIVRDAASNRSGLSAASSTTVDTVAPAATSVMAMLASGTYGIGQIVDIQVQFSENVHVGGTPTLGLMTSPARVATFVTTSGNTVTFRYVVTAGDVANNLDYASSTPIVLNGGWIRDPAGNDARLNLPSPGTPGSLSGSKTITIDALIKVLGGGLSTTLAEAPSFTTRRPTMTITFNTPVIGVNLSAIKLFYEGRSVSLTGATVSGSGTTYTLSIPGVATSLKGAYRLRIGGPGTSITAGGVTMNTPTNLYWRRV